MTRKWPKHLQSRNRKLNRARSKARLFASKDSHDFEAVLLRASLPKSTKQRFQQDSHEHRETPAGLISALSAEDAARLRREARRANSVRFAHEQFREEVFEVPGRSQATARAAPDVSSWEAFVDGTQTWETSWVCPFDPDETKIVIQVAIVSLKDWFSRHCRTRDTVEEDLEIMAGLSDTLNCFEVTLNEDLGDSYRETHQLSIPPTQFTSEESLEVLSKCLPWKAHAPFEDFTACQEIIDDITCMANEILEASKEALRVHGVEDVGEVFGGPLSFERTLGSDCSRFCLHGVSPSEPEDLNATNSNMRRLWTERISASHHRTWRYVEAGEASVDGVKEEVEH